MFFISVTPYFRKFGQQIHPFLEFLAENDTPLTPFFPEFLPKILIFSYIFSNFAHQNVNFSTFEVIWLIFTFCQTFSEEILTNFPSIITLL